MRVGVCVTKELSSASTNSNIIRTVVLEMSFQGGPMWSKPVLGLFFFFFFNLEVTWVSAFPEHSRTFQTKNKQKTKTGENILESSRTLQNPPEQPGQRTEQSPLQRIIKENLHPEV